MKDLSNLTCLVADCGGLHSEFAVRLGRDFGRVLYYVPNDEAFNTHNKSAIGKGYDEIELVDNIHEDEDDIDLYVFPDVGLGPEAYHLKTVHQKPVWGSLLGEELELDRVKAKNILKRLGMPIGPYDILHGIAELEAYLKKQEEGFAKISWFRGEFESRKWKGWDVDEPWFDKLKHQLGTEGEEQEFIFEEMLADKEELGEDLYCVNGQWPSRHLAGIEVKDKSYAGCFKARADFPEPLTRLTTLLTPVMQQLAYCGDFSSEVRIGKDKVPYPIDLTCRRPSPPGETTMEFYTNTPEIVAEGADGNLIDPIPPSEDAKYVCQIVIKSSSHEMTDKQFVLYPEDCRKNVKLHCARKLRKDKYEIVPQNFDISEVGGVTGWGKTLDAARKMCQEVAKEVRGTYIEIDMDSLDQAEEELDKATKIGLKIV